MSKNKALVLIVFSLGLIIISGLMLLGYGLYQRALDPSFKLFNFKNKPEIYDTQVLAKNQNKNKLIPQKIKIALSLNEWVRDVKTLQNRLVIHITTDLKKDRILILDADTGSIITSINFINEP